MGFFTEIFPVILCLPLKCVKHTWKRLGMACRQWLPTLLCWRNTLAPLGFQLLYPSPPSSGIWKCQSAERQTSFWFTSFRLLRFSRMTMSYSALLPQTLPWEIPFALLQNFIAHFLGHAWIHFSEAPLGFIVTMQAENNLIRWVPDGSVASQMNEIMPREPQLRRMLIHFLHCMRRTFQALREALAH